jgi:SAM-dependent methyltransferase
MTSARRRLGPLVVDTACRISQPSRERIAVTGFFLGNEPPLDRLLARTYFALSSRGWAGYETDEGHHAAFRTGLTQIATPPHDVIDLGTGTGGTAALLASTWPTARVTGIDSSRQMIRRARERHRGLAHLTFSTGDGLHLSIEDSSVDLVTSLNYMPFPGEVRRVLRPGGHVLVASTFQGIGSSAVAEHWRTHGCSLVAQEAVAGGSFELYRANQP